MSVRLLALSLLAAIATAAEQRITLYTYSEYIDPALVERFTAETGIAVALDFYEAQEEMLARLQTGAAVGDVLVASDVVIPPLIAQGHVRALDPSLLPSSGNLMVQFRDPQCDRGGVHTRPYLWGPIGVAYDKRAVKEPISWAQILDPARQPEGKVVLMDESRTMLSSALIAAGQDPNSTDPALVAAAGQTLALAKNSPRCIGFDNGVGALNQVMAGQAALAVVYNGDAVRAMPDCAHLGYAVPSEGAVVAVDHLLVLAKSANAAAAHRFIEFLLQPDVAAQNANYLQYATPNQAAMPKIDPAQAANPGIYPPEAVRPLLKSLNDTGAGERIYEQVWEAVKGG